VTLSAHASTYFTTRRSALISTPPQKIYRARRAVRVRDARHGDAPRAARTDREARAQNSLRCRSRHRGRWGKAARLVAPERVVVHKGKASIRDRAPSGRIQGSEGQKTRIRQYARQVDQALRPLLNGLDLPLILAATDPIDSIYRSVNTYPNLLAESLPGNPEASSDAELTESARRVLDGLYAAELCTIRETYALRTSQRRASADIADVARAATHGLVDIVLVDIDEVVPGRVEEETGAVTFDDTDDAVNYGVVDEIARRVWLNGGKVLAVRRDDIPGEASVAAILRYAP
jgi:Bacterial archaeo-eukaryotic release factor family 11